MAHVSSVDRAVPDRPSDWIEALARLGYLAKGIVYVIVGGLAAAAAFGSGGATTGSEGAFATILHQPFGKVLLGLIALGLVGYVVWKLVQGTLDPEHRGTDPKGLVARAYMIVSAIIYAGLVVAAVRMIAGSSSSNGGGGTEGWTAKLMSEPFGRWLVGLVGVAVIGAALQQAWYGWTERFRKRLRLSELPAGTRRWVVRSGKAGLLARAVVFAIIGWFFVRAAVQYDASEAKGLGEALRTIQGQAYGPWLLGIVAIGLIGYGIYQMVKARYRTIAPAQ